MAVEPSRFAQYRVRQFLFTGAVLLMLLSIGSTFVRLPFREALLVDPIGKFGVSLTVITLVVLVSGGVVARWNARFSALWLATGGLVLVSMVPFAGDTAASVVTSVVLVGVVISPTPPWGTSLDYRLSEVVFGAAVLAATTSGGFLTYEQLSGTVSVMAPVGGGIVFGTTVAAVASMGPPAATQSWDDPTTAGSFLSRLTTARSATTVRSSCVRLGSTIRSGVATSREWYPVWTALLAWSVAVCGLHFGGMTYGLYTQFAWWDLMTHSFSGFGVAAVLYLVRPGAFTTSRRLVVFLPAAVIAVGAGFEVYEYLFRGFYEVWSVEHYLHDTIADMIVNTVGALAFGAFPSVLR